MKPPIIEQLRDEIRNKLADQFRPPLNLTIWHNLWRLNYNNYHIGSVLRCDLMYRVRQGN